MGIELAQIIPGIVELTDFDGLLGLIAPRPVLVVSAEEDPYSFDAPGVVGRATVAAGRSCFWSSQPNHEPRADDRRRGEALVPAQGMPGRGAGA